MKLARCSLLVPFLVGLTASSAEGCSSRSEHPGKTGSAIVGGKADFTGFPAVGDFLTTNDVNDTNAGHNCTVELIAPSVALLAAHCVVLDTSCKPRIYDRADAPGFDTTVTFNPPTSKPQQKRIKQRQILIPGLGAAASALYTGLAPSEYDAATGKCGKVPTLGYYAIHPDQDFALLVLDSPVDTTIIKPMQVSSSSSSGPLDVPIEATWVGRDTDLVTRTFSGKVKPEQSLSDTCSVLDPSTPRPVMAQLPFFEHEFTAGAPGENEHGDSGGPLLVNNAIVGVISSLTYRTPCSYGDGYDVFSSIVSNQKIFTKLFTCAKNGNDADCDGIPDSKDDCPSTPDPEQNNANKDIEDATGKGTELGNACDPTPVGIGSMPEDDGISFTGAASNCAPGVPNPAPGACNARVDSYDIELDTVWARDSSEPAGPTTQTTGFRWCICTDANGNPLLDKSLCSKAPYNCGFDDNLFGELPPQTSWLQMALKVGQPQFDSSGNIINQTTWPTDGQNEPYADSQGDVTWFVDNATWDWPADAATWQTAGYWTAHPDSYPSGADIGGVLWTRNNTTLGSAAHGGPDATACAQPGAIGCHYGDNYSIHNPSRRTGACPVPPSFNLFPADSGATSSGAAASSGATASASAAASSPAPSRWLQASDSTLAFPLLSSQSVDSNDPRVPVELIGRTPVESSFASPCGSSDIARVSATERPLLVTELFSPVLADSLLHPAGVIWVAPSEPPALQRPSDYPMSVAVDVDGAPRLAALRDRSGLFRLYPLDTLPPPPAPGGAGPVAYSRTLGETAEFIASSPAGPLDTLRVTGLDEKAIQTALSVGGCLDQKAASLKPACRYHGKPSTDYQLAFRVPRQALPMAGRAAVFTQEDRRLWLVGTTDRRGGQSRLYEIDASTGTVEALRALDPELEHFWFATGADNAVVMIAAPPRGPWYLVALFKPDTMLAHARLELAGLERRTGRPLGGVRIDRGQVLVDQVGAGPLHNPKHPLQARTIGIPVARLQSEKQGTLFAPASP